MYVQLVDVTLGNRVAAPPRRCVHSETCGLALALVHTRELYRCDHDDPDERDLSPPRSLRGESS